MSRSLYIVDGHSHIFRAYHAVGYLSTSKGVPSHAVLILSTMLWKLIREEQPDYLGIALDPPGPTFRDALFTEYKATQSLLITELTRRFGEGCAAFINGDSRADDVVGRDGLLHHLA